MKRNIKATIEFSQNKVFLVLLEKLFDSWVQIYYDSSDIRDVRNFIDLSKMKIKESIGINLSEVSVIIPPSKEARHQSDLIKKRIHISGESISKKDIYNIYQIAKESYSSNENKVILLQPLIYHVEGDETKRYLQAPIFKKGSYLSATFAQQSININVYTYISNLFKSTGLKISHILVSTITISQTNLSVGAREQGAALIHFGDKKTFVSINKNGALIDSLELYDVGLIHLIEKIARELSITTTKAREIIYIYGQIEKTNHVIYNHIGNINNKIIYQHQLSKIIKDYFLRIFSVASKFMRQKDILSLPVVISGWISPFDDIEILGSEVFQSFSKYSPIYYTDNQTENININGVVILDDKLAKMSGHSHDTLVETMPGEYKSIKLLKKHKKTFAHKIMKMIGGNYERDN